MSSALEIRCVVYERPKLYESDFVSRSFLNNLVFDSIFNNNTQGLLGENFFSFLAAFRRETLKFHFQNKTKIKNSFTIHFYFDFNTSLLFMKFKFRNKRTFYYDCEFVTLSVLRIPLLIINLFVLFSLSKNNSKIMLNNQFYLKRATYWRQKFLSCCFASCLCVKSVR